MTDNAIVQPAVIVVEDGVARIEHNPHDVDIAIVDLDGTHAQEMIDDMNFARAMDWLKRIGKAEAATTKSEAQWLLQRMCEESPDPEDAIIQQYILTGGYYYDEED